MSRTRTKAKQPFRDWILTNDARHVRGAIVLAFPVLLVLFLHVIEGVH